MTVKSTEDQKKFDDELKDELADLAIYGDEDGYVDCKIKRVKKLDSGKISIRFNPPVGNTFVKISDPVQTKTDDSLFADILDELGYGLASSEEVIGKDVKFRKNSTGDWEYKNRSSIQETFSSYFSSIEDVYGFPSEADPDRLFKSYNIATIITGLPIVSLVATILFFRGENVKSEDYFVGISIPLLLNLLWFFVLYVSVSLI